MATLYRSIGGTGTLPPPAYERIPAENAGGNIAPLVVVPKPAIGGLDQITEFLGKVAAHVPSEVVAIYAFGKAMAQTPQSEGWWTLICWALALGLRWYGTHGEGKNLNVALTMVAFPIWAFAMGGTILGWMPPAPIPGWSILIFSVIAGALYNNK